MAEFFRAALIALVATLFFALSGNSHAATSPVVQAGSDWAHLTPAQRQFLQPLSADWNNFPEVAKLKWIGLVDRYPKMTPTEQVNVRDRMTEWSKLTPQERTKARERYKKLRTAPSAERKQLEQKWREYEALPAEEKQALKVAPKTQPPASASGPSVINQAIRPPKAVVVAPRTVKPNRQPPPSPLQSPSLGQSAPTPINK